MLADWNGLMIAALANAGAMLGEPAWIEMAARAFAFIARSMTQGDRLGHSWRDGRLLYPGPCLRFRRHDPGGAGAVRGDRRARLSRAGAGLAARLRRHYANPDNGGYFLTADDAEGLVVRPAATTDDATPNPNAIAAQNLVRLAALTGDDAMARAGRPAVRRRAGRRGRQPVRSMPALLNALDLRLHAAEIVVTGPRARRASPPPR